MKVAKIGEVLGRGMVSVIEDLKGRINAGEVISLVIIVEIEGKRVPMTVMRGGYKRDPYRALIALTRAQYLVHQQLDQQDFQEYR
jgi:hypothetical protein